MKLKFMYFISFRKEFKTLGINDNILEYCPIYWSVNIFLEYLVRTKCPNSISKLIGK